MNLTIENIFLILCIIDMTLCVVCWLFYLAEKLIDTNLSRTSKTVVCINSIKDVLGKTAVVLFDLIVIAGLIYVGYICLWVESPFT